MLNKLPYDYIVLLAVLGIMLVVVLSGFLIYILWSLVYNAFINLTVKWKKKYDQSERIIQRQKLIIDLLKKLNTENINQNIDKALAIESSINKLEQELLIDNFMNN